MSNSDYDLAQRLINDPQSFQTSDRVSAALDYLKQGLRCSGDSAVSEAIFVDKNDGYDLAWLLQIAFDRTHEQRITGLYFHPIGVIMTADGYLDYSAVLAVANMTGSHVPRIMLPPRRETSFIEDVFTNGFELHVGTEILRPESVCLVGSELTTFNQGLLDNEYYMCNTNEGRVRKYANGTGFSVTVNGASDLTYGLDVKIQSDGVVVQNNGPNAACLFTIKKKTN
ncbi:hypothetical protein COV18_06235 [Candidatus Woesearchaeota archaeon CG10_big_fil_rev_8_21_14_0_10_37_12]|nr:MAG: hypothetical protein COV18_06235 [Candidatus Woesearchaeota archaeon CG10_big_fil_rev_8_21_14_0_10_37_12]